MSRAWPARAKRCVRASHACRRSTGCNCRDPLPSEDAASLSSRGSFRREPCCESRNSAGDGQTYRELGATTVDVGGADRTAVRLRDRLRDRESESGPVALRVLASIETLQQTG